MKFYIYALIVLTALGFLLAGCAQPGTDKSSTSRNKAEAPESKTSPQKAETNPAQPSGDSAKAITVYKSPTCGCCSKWEEHLTKAGFRVTSKPTDNMAEIRKQYNVPDKMQSCHTAIIDGYVIEGHVPADDVKKLLETRPADVAGLAAPGMPPKSPGMQPEGEKPSGYDVLSFDRQGNSKVFASY
jgi:hypothetical protein